MADYPQSHTTHVHTTTTTTTMTGARGKIHFDVASVKTLPGILRIVEIILSLITFICSVAACASYFGYSFGSCGWSGFVAFMAFITVIGWLLFYMLHVQEAIAANVPWLLVEFIFYAIFTFLFLTAGIALSALSHSFAGYNYNSWANWWYKIHSAAGAGAFFAFATMIVFGVHTFFLFRDWRSSRLSNPPRGPHQGIP